MKKSKFLQNSKDLLSRSFNPAKCKTSLRLGASRLKLLRNKKQVQLNQMKREISQLIESGQDQTARIRVEHVIREENMMAAYDLLEIYCELIVARLPIIESQKNCPIDLKEAIASVLFASPRCGDVPELLDVRKNFTAKYGKDFTTAAIELRPACGVSRMLVEKLSATAPDGQAKIKILSAIAEEFNVKWDPKSFEEKDSVTPSDLLNGSNTSGNESKVYVEPSRMESPVVKAPPSNNKMHTTPLNFSQTSSANTTFHPNERPPALGDERSQLLQGDSNTIPPDRQRWNMEFKDATAAAQAAAESAERASMAARAAAELSICGRTTKQYSTESHKPDIYILKNEGPESHTKSKLTSEQNYEEFVERSSSERTRLHNEKIDGIQTDDLKTAGKFREDGRGGTKIYSESASSKSKALTDDVLLNHGFPVVDRHSRKNSSEEDYDIGVNMKKHLSTYEAEIANGSPDKSENIREERVGKQLSVKSFRSSISDDVNIFATSEDTKFGYDSGEEPFVGAGKEYAHEEASPKSSHESASVFFDKFDSDTDDPGFDIGPKYDEQEPEFHFPSPSQKSSEHLSINTDSLSPKSSSSKVTNSTPSLFFTRKNSSPDFSENLTSVNSSELDSSMPMTFDESDGPASDSDEDINISRHTAIDRDLSSEISINGQSIGLQFSDEHGQSVGSSFKENGYSGFDRKHLPLSSDDELKSDEMNKERNQRKILDADSPEKISPGKLSAGHPTLGYKKSQMEPNDLGKEASPDNEGLNFDKLTGGLRHKGYNRPPYMKNRFDESSSLKEETTTTIESPKNSTMFDHMKSSRTPELYSHDSESSEEEDFLPKSSSAGKEMKTKLNIRASNSIFGSDNSDLDEDAPKDNYLTRKNHIQSGISRRTKASPSSGTNSYSKTRVTSEALYSDAGMDRKPTTSYISKPPKEPQTEKRNSSQWENYEQPSSAKLAIKPAKSNFWGPPEQSKEVKSATQDPEASRATKPTKPTNSTDHLSSIQESKIFRKSSGIEEPARKTETSVRIENPRATTYNKTSSNKDENPKKERHVHPKLPDYDTLVQSLRMNRT
ncbi:hypothetical protein ACJIZ3_021266 [Penstemon smallii]|uniref:Uncharacterized protein n=1 Tax=Penstemon smallii TaxID=265156 RepID=A0ABD3SL92_9LAMI